MPLPFDGVLSAVVVAAAGCHPANFQPTHNTHLNPHMCQLTISSIWGESFVWGMFRERIWTWSHINLFSCEVTIDIRRISLFTCRWHPWFVHPQFAFFLSLTEYPKVCPTFNKDWGRHKGMIDRILTSNMSHWARAAAYTLLGHVRRNVWQDPSSPDKGPLSPHTYCFWECYSLWWRIIFSGSCCYL